MHFLTKIDSALEYLEKALVVVLFAALVLLITFNILVRNLFGVSFQETLVLPPTLVLYISLFGATLALKKGRHIKLEILLRYTSLKTRRTARLISGLFGMAVMAILFVASLFFVKNEWTILGFRGATALVFPLFFALASFRYLLRSFTGPNKPDQREDGQYRKADPSGIAHPSREDL